MRAQHAVFFAGCNAPGAGATVQQVAFDVMTALASTAHLCCTRRCRLALGKVDGLLRRALRREHVQSRCARTPWPFLMINGAIFRAQR